MRAVRRQRARFAAHHCAHCFGSQYTPEERAHLVSLLEQLGDGPRLRLRIGLCRLGFAPWLERGARLRGRIKAALKTAIKR